MRTLLLILAIVVLPCFAYAQDRDTTVECSNKSDSFLLAAYSDWKTAYLDVNNMEYLHNQNFRCRYVNVVGDYSFWVVWEKQRCPGSVYYNVKTGAVRDASKGSPE